MDELYADLPGDTTSSHILKLEAENETLTSRIRELEKRIISHENDVEDMRKRLDTKERENQILRTNSSSLYLTAKAEFDRKDKQIETYRQLIDKKDKEIEKLRQSSFRNQRCKEYRSDRSQDFCSTKKSGDRYFSSIQKEDVIQDEKYEDSKRYCDERPKHVPLCGESKEELSISRTSDKIDCVSRNRRPLNMVMGSDKKNRENSYGRSTNIVAENIKKNRKDSSDHNKSRADKSENTVIINDRRYREDLTVRRKSRNARSPIESLVKTSSLKNSFDRNKFRGNVSADTISTNNRKNSVDRNTCVELSSEKPRSKTTNERQIYENLSNQIKCTGDKSADTIITNRKNNSKDHNTCDEFSGKRSRDKKPNKRQICEDLPNQIKCVDGKSAITTNHLNISKDLNACDEFSGKRSRDKVMNEKRLCEELSNHVECTVDKSASTVVTNNKQDQKDSSDCTTLYAEEYAKVVITSENPNNEDLTVFVESCGTKSPNVTPADKTNFGNSSEQFKFRDNKSAENSITVMDGSNSKDESICSERSCDVSTNGRQLCEDSSDQIKFIVDKSANIVSDEKELKNSTDSVSFCDHRSSNIVTTSVKISSVSLMMNGNEKKEEFTSVCKVTSTDDAEHGVFKRKRKRIS